MSFEQMLFKKMSFEQVSGYRKHNVTAFFLPCQRNLIEKLGAVHVRHPQSGGRAGYPVRTRREGGIQMRTFALFVAKTFGFFNNYRCFRTDKGEGGCSNAYKEKRVNFLRTSFMDGPLYNLT